MLRKIATVPPLPCYKWVGLASVGNDTVKHLLELDKQGTTFFFFFFGGGGRPQLVVELDHLCEVNNLCSAQVGMIASRGVRAKAPKRQLHSNPIAVSESGYTPEIKLIH